MKRKMMLVAVLAALLMMSVGFMQPVTASSVGVDDKYDMEYLKETYLSKTTPCPDGPLWRIIMAFVELLSILVPGIVGAILGWIARGNGD